MGIIEVAIIYKHISIWLLVIGYVQRFTIYLTFGILFSSSSYEVSFVVVSKETNTVISSTTISALSATELDTCLDIAIDAESSVTFSQRLVATADASVEVSVKIDLAATVAVADMHSVTLSAPIAMSQKAEIEASMATSISASAG